MIFYALKAGSYVGAVSLLALAFGAGDHMEPVARVVAGLLSYFLMQGCEDGAKAVADREAA